MSLKNKKVLLFIFLTITAFIAIRTIHFTSHLNFSTDQATSSSESYKLLQNKEIVLIGPPTSLNIEGRQIFHGSISYYTQLLFLALGNFDPVSSSFIFMLVAAFSVIPLFLGVKLLTNQKTAIAVTSLYALLPFYINYTRFLWNPNFQFVLTPFLIYFMGLYKKHNYENVLYLFLAGLSLGVLFQFHYQFILLTVVLLIYYLLTLKTRNKHFICLILGFLVGLGPLLLFEIRNNFYQIRTVAYYINYTANNSPNSPTINIGVAPHYFLSLSLFIAIVIVYKFSNKLKKYHLYTLIAFLLFIDLLIYIPKPTHGFGMVENWNYSDELKSHEIIKSSDIENYNIANLTYNTTAEVQKYLLLIDGIDGYFDDYYSNKYLFVITNKDDYQNDPAYEISNFKPHRVNEVWEIDEYNELILLERL